MEGGSILAGKELPGVTAGDSSGLCSRGQQRGDPSGPGRGTCEKPGGEPYSFHPPEARRRVRTGAPRTGCVAEPPQACTGSRPAAATYSSGCSQQQGGGKGEPREREETQLLLGGAAVPLCSEVSRDNTRQPR